LQIIGVIFQIMMACVCPLAFAADGNPTLAAAPAPVKVKHYIQGAVMLELTERGSLLFQNHLADIIDNEGLDFYKGHFADYQWKSNTSYKLEDLAPDADTKKLLQTIDGILHSWFNGFPLSEIRPTVEIGNSGYKATINHIAISTDENLLHQLKKTEGAVLVLQVEIKEIDAGAQKIRVWDLNAEDMGQVGFDNAMVKVGGSSPPLQLRMPFYVKINASGIPEFEAVGLDQNIDKVNLEFTYKNIVIPVVETRINNKVVITPKKEKLQEEFLQNMPTVLIRLRNYLHDFASQQIPELLNEKAKQYLVGALEEIRTIDAPGDTTKPPHPFMIGQQLKSLNQNGGLQIVLNMFVEDLQNPYSKPILSTSGGEKIPPAQIDGLDKTKYDLAFAIHDSVINRILQLSYERKLFANIPLDGKSPSDASPSSAQANTAATTPQVLTMLKAPVLLPLTKPGLVPRANIGETYARVHLVIRVPPQFKSIPIKSFGDWWKDLTNWGTRNFVISDRFELTLDLIVKLKKNATGRGLQILLWDVDPDSFAVDEDSLTLIGDAAIGTIMDVIKSRFATMTQSWREKDTAIPGNISVPPFFGYSFLIDNLVMEPTGHITLYLDFDMSGAADPAEDN